jgi:hypothetical protein
MVCFFEEGARRFFNGEDPPTLTSLVHLMPDISYDEALARLRGTAHEVSFLRGKKKDLVWNNCDEALAAGLQVSKTLRVDCARTLSVFMKVMFEVKLTKDGTNIYDGECASNGSESEDSLGEFDLSGGANPKDDEVDTRARRSDKRGSCIIEGSDEDEPKARI